MKKLLYVLPVALLIGFSACKSSKNPNALKPEEVVSKLQEKLINAKEGDVIELPEGTYELTKPMSLDKISGITIKGQGMDKTILSFKNQDEGAEGFKISGAKNFIISDMTILDTKGDIIKAQECEEVTFRNLKVGWTNGPDSSNGSYALYPVTCNKVIVEGCDVFAASDAGIYVGQSKNIIVRNNHVHQNVAGIEIENCTNAQVYKNNCENNTGGICVFDMPDIPVKMGGTIRVYDNDVKNNNLKNFAPVGNTVAIVPAGTGSFILSGQNVEFFNNRFSDHRTIGTGVISYLIIGKPLKDTMYDPFYSGIYIHDNVYSHGALDPDTTKDMGRLMGHIFGNNVPDIAVDGIYNPMFVDPATGKMKGNAAVCVRKNGNAKIAGLDAPNNFKSLNQDPNQFDCELNIQNDESWVKKDK